MIRKVLPWLICLSLLVSCNRSMTMEDVYDEPQFTGIVTDLLLDEGSVLLQTREETIGEYVKVRMMPELEDSYTDFKVGDEIRVYYDGKYDEGEPNAILHPYAFTLEMSAKEYCDNLVIDEASEQDFERCGIDKKLMYKEELHDEEPNHAKYSTNHFEDEHLLEVTKKVHEVIWNWYIEKANSMWKEQAYETHTQLVKINGETKFTIVYSYYDRYAKYFIYGVEFDEDTNTYVLRKIHENNENDVSPRLIEILSSNDEILYVTKDFENYKQNENGNYVPNVTPYAEYEILESDSSKNIYDKVHSYVANEMGCKLETNLGYCDIETYYYYTDGELNRIVSDVSDLVTNVVYYFEIKEGKINFRQGSYEHQLPQDSKTIFYETMSGKRKLERKGNELFETAN